MSPNVEHKFYSIIIIIFLFSFSLFFSFLESMKRVFGFVRRRKGKKTQPLSSEVDKASPFGSDGFVHYFPDDPADDDSPFRSSNYHYALNEYLQTVVEPGNDSMNCRSYPVDQDKNILSMGSSQPIPESVVDDDRSCEDNPLDIKVIYAELPPPPPPPSHLRKDPSATYVPIMFVNSQENAPQTTEYKDCYFFDGGDGMYQGKPQRQPINEPNMPDATYEETYGDSYVGGPIRYIYPSGYHSLRPRSGPWKLSLLVFATFSWLSVFIVGYCADMVDLSIAYDASIDDYSRKLETQWCGSTLVKMMWVLSLSITGIAAAYCSIIGYVQGRDFVVANCRSQPPGMPSGASDYYVKIEDMKKVAVRPHNRVTSSHHPSYQSGRDASIYQADGTPQFWGDYIYRPTQAAVAVTSR